MNATTRLAAYGAVLAASFAAAAGIGLAAGPIDTGGKPTHDGAPVHADDPPQVEPGPPDRPGTSLDAAGYTATMTGQPRVGSTALSFRFELDGEAVTTEPYLGAVGHLVVLRGGDLADVHAHADHRSTDQDDPSIVFDVEFPSPGTYRLFLDVVIDGAVHTAPFTVRVPEPGTTETTPAHEGH